MGGRGTGSALRTRAVTRAIATEEDKIWKDDYETAACIGADGKVLFRESQHAEDYVMFTPQQCAQMKGATLTHNHPGGTTFSEPDVDLLIKNELNTIRAVGRNGGNYQLTKISDSDRAANFGKDYKAARAQCKAVTDKIFNTQESKWLNGEITDAQFQTQINNLNSQLNQMYHNWLTNNAGKYGYEYTLTIRR